MKIIISILLVLVGILYFRFYRLPYGELEILPDHPLYRVTVLRDKVMLGLIADPVKKIEYYLILSDRGAHASRALLEKGNIRLAKETALKAENYDTLLVTDYKWVVWRHTSIPEELVTEIQGAIIRHRDIFQDMMDRVSQDDAAVFQTVIDFAERNEREFLSVRPVNL